MSGLLCMFVCIVFLFINTVAGLNTSMWSICYGKYCHHLALENCVLIELHAR